jgi:hypothetical protein
MFAWLQAVCRTQDRIDARKPGGPSHQAFPYDIVTKFPARLAFLRSGHKTYCDLPGTSNTPTHWG